MFFRRFLTLTALTITTGISSLCFADDCAQAECVSSIEVGFGWRRDNVKWKMDDVNYSGGGSYYSHPSARVDSHLKFSDINIYTTHLQAKWAGREYYVRLLADYGLSDKGHFQEDFRINSSLFGGSLSTEVHNPVRKRSEFYDFNGAVGYPFTFCECRLLVVPLIGFSFHRQRIRTRPHAEDSSFTSDFSFQSSSNPFDVTSTSALLSDNSSSNGSSSNSSSSYFDPFPSESAESNVASLIGFKPKRKTSNYRFTWYGFYLGTDISYALDPSWTLFAEIEAHFFDRCHRKRSSYTAVDFVDKYHKIGWAYGVNSTIGTTFNLGNCWFSTLAVDFKYWKTTDSKHKHDSVQWKSAAIHWSLGYMF